MRNDDTPPRIIRLTDQDFLERFRPLANPLRDEGGIDFGYGACLLETYGPELDLVGAADPARVWTLLEEDGVIFIASGRRFVNRLGYILCEVPVGPARFIRCAWAHRRSRLVA